MKNFSFVIFFFVLLSCSGSGDTKTENTMNENSGMQDHTKPKDGEYTFDMAFAEWRGKSMGEKVKIIVEGDSVKVLYAGGGEVLDVEEGEIMDQGLLLKHKSGDWIIGEDPSDKNVEPVGGCSGGPNVIDFENKKYWTC